MIAIVTLLAALPLGYFLHSRFAANTIYAVAYLWAFVYQTLYLTLASLGGEPDPAFRAGELPLAYGLVALLIFAAGFALVALGRAVRGRRESRIVLARRVGPGASER